MVHTSSILFFQMSITEPLKMSIILRRYFVRKATFIASLAALVWISVLAVQPVHVPIQDFSKGHIPHHTQALTGVKGQTIAVPSNLLSRIDIWMRTRVNPGETTQVTFQLKHGIDRKGTIASGIVVFSRTDRAWHVRLTFDPSLVSQGDTVYLRMESILPSPNASLDYAYVPGDLYAPGELLDLDRLEVPGQDLRFKLYREPRLPKPLAWLEAAVAPAVAAAQKAHGPPAWLIGSLMAIVGGLIVSFVVIGSILTAHTFPGRIRLEATAALIMVEAAVALAMVAGTEAPIGKLWVHLA